MILSSGVASRRFIWLTMVWILVAAAMGLSLLNLTLYIYSGLGLLAGITFHTIRGGRSAQRTPTQEESRSVPGETPADRKDESHLTLIEILIALGIIVIVILLLLWGVPKLGVARAARIAVVPATYLATASWDEDMDAWDIDETATITLDDKIARRLTGNPILFDDMALAAGLVSEEERQSLVQRLTSGLESNGWQVSVAQREFSISRVRSIGATERLSIAATLFEIPLFPTWFEPDEGSAFKVRVDDKSVINLAAPPHLIIAAFPPVDRSIDLVRDDGRMIWQMKMPGGGIRVDEMRIKVASPLFRNPVGAIVLGWSFWAMTKGLVVLVAFVVSDEIKKLLKWILHRLLELLRPRRKPEKPQSNSTA